jgi:GT2 family glycosyltransferase
MIGKISVLIVNWRSKEYVRRCLQSMQAGEHDLIGQIVVVDSGSFDGCGEMLAAEFPQVDFVQSQGNVGFGRANNLGFERVNQPLLLLLNPDTELKPGSLARLLEALESREDAGIVSPRLLNTDGTLQKSSVMAFPTPLNQALRSEFLMKLLPNSRLWGAGDAYASREPTPVEAVSGACMLMKAGLFRRLGGFRPDYFMYAEDMDLCLRIQRLGLVNYHVPGAEVIHHGGGSSRTQISQFSTTMMRVAHETYMRLNHGHPTAWSYRLLQGFAALVRVMYALPQNFLTFGRMRATAHRTLVKNWYVLKWSLGFSALANIRKSSC